MDRSLPQIVAELDALTERDFDPMVLDATGDERLHEACAELAAHHDPNAWAPALYSLMERLGDSDLGSPGPVVHTLEAWAGYRHLLAESLRRRPAPLTVWMANRILNSDPADADDWLALLRAAATHPRASAGARADAQGFLQSKKQGDDSPRHS